MRVFQLLLLFVAIVTAARWSKEDYEIFNLNDKIQQDLGKSTTFYSWLKLEKVQNQVYKKSTKLTENYQEDYILINSLLLQDQRKADERFQRLSLVGNILRDQSLKRRYDYFYSKGFPKWKGTGYYYSKFRPGVVFTLFILYILVSVFHFCS